jgi:hypothetical protein
MICVIFISINITLKYDMFDIFEMIELIYNIYMH